MIVALLHSSAFVLVANDTKPDQKDLCRPVSSRGLASFISDEVRANTSASFTQLRAVVVSALCKDCYSRIALHPSRLCTKYHCR